MGHRVTGYNPEYKQKHPNCSWVRERPWADLSHIHPGVNPVDSTWIKIPQGETPVTGNVATCTKTWEPCFVHYIR